MKRWNPGFRSRCLASDRDPDRDGFSASCFRSRSEVFFRCEGDGVEAEDQAVACWLQIAEKRRRRWGWGEELSAPRAIVHGGSCWWRGLRWGSRGRLGLEKGDGRRGGVWWGVRVWRCLRW